MTKQQLTELIDLILVDNISQEVTPEDMRVLLFAFRDDYYHKTDDQINLQALIDDLTPGLSTTYSSSKIVQLLSAFASVERTSANIAGRNALANKKDQENVYVTDATGDPSVSLGWAIYKYILSIDTWIKIAEQESLDINLTNKADLVGGKVPASQLPAAPAVQTAGIPAYDPLASYLSGDQVTHALKIWAAKANLAPGVTPVEGLSWTELSSTHLQNSDTALKRASNGAVLTADDIANYDLVLPANRFDANLPGNPAAGDRLWQILSKLWRSINNHLQSIDTIQVANRVIVPLSSSAIGGSLSRSITLSNLQTEAFWEIASATATLALDGATRGKYLAITIKKTGVANLALTLPSGSFGANDSGLNNGTVPMLFVGPANSYHELFLKVSADENNSVRFHWVKGQSFT